MSSLLDDSKIINISCINTKLLIIFNNTGYKRHSLTINTQKRELFYRFTPWQNGFLN